ncbi:ATP-binding cassette domain-containing protein [Paenibacillus herberti]|uniref:ABC transporter domain-containing protein n=1 Tax=Paenibacillus herberti TaxID=1619309 RepID=A0A229NY11_9BACL|nr:ATP-binding cassette domain-containing protein [Paenibacillus herberti]OXM14793.1 hypothetical protein CGZ75_18145 [Paenibacillus herberti]
MGLEAKHLIKRYGDNTVLHGISLEAGTGKATTIRSILGMVDYDSGAVTWNGRPITENRPSIGYLPEERGRS